MEAWQGRIGNARARARAVPGGGGEGVLRVSRTRPDEGVSRRRARCVVGSGWMDCMVDVVFYVGLYPVDNGLM